MADYALSTQNRILQTAVKVKKVQFNLPPTNTSRKSSRDLVSRRGNFEEFRGVYDIKAAGNQPPLRKTKSGSLFRAPTPSPTGRRRVETINIELPANLGADCAILPAIRPKVYKKSVVKTVSREVAADFEEPSAGDPAESQKRLKEVEAQVNSRREKISKGLHKYARPVKKRDKIMSALTNIDEKLKRMQDKYLVNDRVTYKSVTDCFTQSSTVEVLFENQKYPKPEEVKAKPVSTERDANENINSNPQENPNQSRNSVDTLKRSPESITANNIIRNVTEAKSRKLKTIRQEIATVENFFDRMKAIADSDSDGNSEPISPPVNTKIFGVPYFEEGGDDLERIIRKSSFLSKQLNPQPVVKVFSDKHNNFLRDRQSFSVAKSNDSKDSVTKIIDKLQLSLEHSLYVPMSQK